MLFFIVKTNQILLSLRQRERSHKEAYRCDGLHVAIHTQLATRGVYILSLLVGRFLPERLKGLANKPRQFTSDCAEGTRPLPPHENSWRRRRRRMSVNQKNSHPLTVSNLMSVDLPAPFGPTMPTRLDRLRAQLTSCRLGPVLPG